MIHIVFRLDDAACRQLTALRERARAAGFGVPAGRPAVAVAAAAAVPPQARAALAAELRLLTLPSLWLATLGATAGRPEELVLAAVVDTELLAVHTAVHDALAGRVRGPVADYLPGSWLPHCVLVTGVLVTGVPATGARATGALATGPEAPARAFAHLHPAPAVRARATAVEIHDGRTVETVA